METRQERVVRGGGSGLDEQTVRRGQDRKASRGMQKDLRAPIWRDLGDSEAPRERRLGNVRGYRDRDSQSGRRPGERGQGREGVVSSPERRIPRLASRSARSLRVASRSRRDECAFTLRKARWIPRVRSDSKALDALWRRAPLGNSPQSWVGSRPAVWCAKLTLPRRSGYGICSA